MFLVIKWHHYYDTHDHYTHLDKYGPKTILLVITACSKHLYKIQPASETTFYSCGPHSGINEVFCFFKFIVIVEDITDVPPNDPF